MTPYLLIIKAIHQVSILRCHNDYNPKETKPKALGLKLSIWHEATVITTSSCNIEHYKNIMFHHVI